MPIGQEQMQAQAAQIQKQTVAVGAGYMAVVKEDGSLWTWGSNWHGQLGDGTTENRYTPMKIMDNVVSVSISDTAGSGNVVAVKSDGSLWTWGSDNELGGYSKTPIKVMDDVVFASIEYHIAAIKSDGSLWIWGHNYSGGLGDGTTKNSDIPIKIMDDVISVSVGNGYTTAIKNDGSLWTWGYNGHGELGNGTTENSDTPTKIMDNVISVSAGNGHVAAIKSDKSLWTWGFNMNGCLGDGTNEDRHSPTKIMDNVSSVSAGGHTTVIKSDNTLQTFGNFWIPSEIEDMNNFVIADTGDECTAAVTSDGSLWFWEIKSKGESEWETPVKIMDGVMLPSGTNAVAPKEEQSPQPPAEQTQQPSAPKANYIYGEEEKEVVLPTDKLSKVETVEDAKKAAEEAVASMSEKDKTSADGADKTVLFANEAISRASAVKTDSNSIVINDEMVTEIEQKASEAEQRVSQAFSSVRKVRSGSRNARIVTSSEDKISIRKENISKDIDNVEVATNYAKVSFPAKSVSEVSLENKGTNKIAVDFGNKNTTEKVQISFPNMDKNKKYVAVVDENGNAIGGKYNPITGELSAKIEKSGIYAVIDNEKNFEDVKDKSAEMQEAIKLLASKGIISGTSETKFSPDKSISRAEVAAIILRTLSKLDQNADGGFSDVTKQNWYYGVAGSAKQTGIISGYPDNTFRGNVVIPKVQIVSVAARVLKNEMNYFDVTDVEKILSVYGDSTNIAKWAKNDVALATDVNMVIRRTDSLFGGEDEMTRGDAAIILKRLFDKIW